MDCAALKQGWSGGMGFELARGPAQDGVPTATLTLKTKAPVNGPPANGPSPTAAGKAEPKAKAKAEAKKKKDKKDYMWMNLTGQKLEKAPGQIDGEGFVIYGCEDCELRIFDRTNQVFVDYCKNTRVFLGAVCGSIFIRNCENVVIKACCQQLRTRECTDCDFFLIVPGDPIVETSLNMRFAPLLADLYPEQADHMKAGSLQVTKNGWAGVYDFSPGNPPGLHWSLVDDVRGEAGKWLVNGTEEARLHEYGQHEAPKSPGARAQRLSPAKAAPASPNAAKQKPDEDSFRGVVGRLAEAGAGRALAEGLRVPARGSRGRRARSRVRRERDVFEEYGDGDPRRWHARGGCHGGRRERCAAGARCRVAVVRPPRPARRGVAGVLRVHPPLTS